LRVRLSEVSEALEPALSHQMMTLWRTLPAKQRERVAREVLSSIDALDREINRVLRPSLGRSESGYLVSDDLIPLYGVGASPTEAMDDYRSVVVEYFEDLEADAANLGPELQRHLELLRPVVATLNEGP